MFGNPEDIASKPIAQHFLEHLILDLTVAPANRLLILVQTQPGIEGKELTPDEKKPQREGIKYFARQIYKQEGVAGFWKGCVFDIIKNGAFRIFHSFFLHLYEPLMNVEDPTRGDLRTVSIECLLFCAVEASLQLIQHPFKVMRVRLAALETPMDPNAPKGFRKISHCVRRIWNEDGFKGFYRGFGVALLESITNALYISIQRVVAQKFVAISSEDNSFWGKMKDVASERSAGSVLSAAMTVTSVGQNIRKKLRTIVFQFGRYLGNLLVLYPFRVIQRRVIMHKDQWKVKQTSVRGLVREIWRREGLGGLYSGLTAQILLDTGITAVTPFITKAASAVLPEQIKEAVPKVGDISAPVENTIGEITDAAVEQVSTVTEKVGETLKETAVVEKIKDLAGTSDTKK